MLDQNQEKCQEFESKNRNKASKNGEKSCSARSAHSTMIKVEDLDDLNLKKPQKGNFRTQDRNF